MEASNTPFRRKMCKAWEAGESKHDFENNQVELEKDSRGMPYYFVTVKPVRRYRTDREFFNALDSQLWREFNASALERERIHKAMHIIVETSLLIYRIIDVFAAYREKIYKKIERMKHG